MLCALKIIVISFTTQEILQVPVKFVNKLFPLRFAGNTSSPDPFSPGMPHPPDPFSRGDGQYSKKH
jgi:hypothetical protein